jgi:hypothetical protein
MLLKKAVNGRDKRKEKILLEKLYGTAHFGDPSVWEGL